jgi:hypothetical protein
MRERERERERERAKTMPIKLLIIKINISCFDRSRKFSNKVIIGYVLRDVKKIPSGCLAFMDPWL